MCVVCVCDSVLHVQAHDEVCEEGVVKCSNEGCGLEMKRKEVRGRG